MELAGYLPLPEMYDTKASDITGFYQDGREFAVVGLKDAISAVFIDITDPTNPFEVGHINGTPALPSGWRDIKYWNRHVYIGTEVNDGIKVVSVNDPDNPTLVNTISDITNSHNIHIDADGYLYVVGGSSYDVWIYDLTMPAFPQLVGTWNGEYLHDIEVFNNKIYGAAIYSGNFYIIDVSDKTNPITLLNHYTGLSGISTHDCAVTDDEQYLITADETSGGHIKIWDISDYDNINLVSEYMTHPEHSMHNVYVRPGTDLLIMSYYVDGTRILDISDPVNPVEVGYYDTSELTELHDGNWGTYAYLPSGYIISSDRQNGLFIFSSPLTMNNVVFDGCPIAPATPYITVSESFKDSIKIAWDALSEFSLDSTTVGYDFEGYRLYRSLDHGETWGDDDEKIYDDDGMHVGWQPYVQFNSNTGIKNNFTDTGVYPFHEYCYVVTSYDLGLVPGYMAPNGWTYEEGYPSLESDYSNMVCLFPLAQDVYTPQTEFLFKEDGPNIGWSQINYIPHSVDTVNTGLYKFEIQAEIDSSTYLLSKTLNPKLFVYEVDENGAQISDYIVQDFPIYSIDEEAPDSTAWLDILGMYVKIENYYFKLPDFHLPVDSQFDIQYSNESLSDKLNILISSQMSPWEYHRRPYFDYKIEFGNVSNAFKTSPVRSCEDNGFPLSENGDQIFTFLPFSIFNLSYDSQDVSLSHYDKGSESGENNFGLAPPGECTPICIHPLGEICYWSNCVDATGYGNCTWEQSEILIMIDTVYDVYGYGPDGLTGINADGATDNSVDDSYYWEEKFYKLLIAFNAETYFDPNVQTWQEDDSYYVGDIVLYEGMLWETQSNIFSLSPDAWLDDDGDNINDNPWQIQYPWEDGDSITLISHKMLHDGDSWLVDTDIFNQSSLANSNLAVVPESFKLEAPYPNPFNPVIAIEYSLPYASNVLLVIYDLMGRQVDILYNGIQQPNNYTISWDASNYSSGVYFIKMSVGDSQSFISQSRKVVLLK